MAADIVWGKIDGTIRELLSVLGRGSYQGREKHRVTDGQGKVKKERRGGRKGEGGREWERERYEKRIMADEDESKPEDVNYIRKERRER